MNIFFFSFQALVFISFSSFRGKKKDDYFYKVTMDSHFILSCLLKIVFCQVPHSCTCSLTDPFLKTKTETKTPCWPFLSTLCILFLHFLPHQTWLTISVSHLYSFLKEYSAVTTAILNQVSRLCFQWLNLVTWSSFLFPLNYHSLSSPLALPLLIPCFL